jgi:two-component system OmpR family response regulator
LSVGNFFIILYTTNHITHGFAQENIHHTDIKIVTKLNTQIIKFRPDGNNVFYWQINCLFVIGTYLLLNIRKMETGKLNKEIEALIVEDEPDICFLLGSILRRQHVQSDYATCLFDAQKALKKGHPDILFIDNHLPDGYGVDLIPVVKMEYPHTKIVVMTSQDTGADEDKALRMGADYFIGKPFTQATIINTLNAVLHLQ